MLRARLARHFMNRFPVSPPDPLTEIGGLQEIFRHPAYTCGDEALRHDWRAASAGSRYEDERAYPWDAYFEVELGEWLSGKHALDLGCFTGGRAVAWLERYGLASIAGVDVDPVFIQAAREFADERGSQARFRVGTGEHLPFGDGEFDAVLSFDVLEHVRDVRATLLECRRVLRPGGIMAIVFPGFWHPTEHHLSLASRAPFLHHMFGARACLQAYVRILAERGPSAAWYRRENPTLESWERGHTLNGATLRSFHRDLSQTGPWTILHQSRKPVGALGRQAQVSPLSGLVAAIAAPLARTPVVREIALHRVAMVLRRGDPGMAVPVAVR